MNSESGDDFAFRQVMRLSGLRGFPQAVEAVNELVEALMTAPTEDAATNFVSEWLHECVEAPRPADVYRHFKPPAFREYDPAAPVCEKCGGTSWVPVESGGVKRCVCVEKKPRTEELTKENL